MSTQAVCPLGIIYLIHSITNQFFLDFSLIFCFSLKLETVCFFVSEQTYKFSRESNNSSPRCIYFNNLNL